ncbi:sigma-54-dependent transcriptional regulator [Marinobacter alexandrii]|uniref:sigma-54-dependent transcriptional regulator n=1 Tax=Marinobacter alexandrii TaxID=2570351 RepID=UPI003299FBB8
MTKQTVLIVDDEPDIRELLDITLSRMGLNTYSAENLANARALFDERHPNLCLTDMRLPDGNGISLVEYIQAENPDVPVAMITAHGSVETAIEALKAGAFDFISKPIELESLRNIVTAALQLEGDSSETVRAVDNQLIGSAPAISALRQQITKFARSQAPIHIHGESGSGKEVVARLIHNNGPRASGPFVAVNCGAIPPELMESELFGHMKGSFTGAMHDKIGLFQAASGGTLFLDEVADLPLAMQVKLLRAIQEKVVRPVGANEEHPTDIRLVSATHKALSSEVDAGRFRNDLFYRINVIDVYVPALRERSEDIPELAQVLLQRAAMEMGIENTSIEPDALHSLATYDFPGNVRELENVLERALALSDNGQICASDLQFPSKAAELTAVATQNTEHSPRVASSVDSVNGDLEGYLAEIEKNIIAAELEASRWNKTNTAKALGISFRSLRYRLKKLGLED